MPQTSSIAKNTLFLYVRMLATLCVTLYTSRVVLQALGVIDYGIYNVVAGVSTSLVFFSSTLSTSTQRFLNFEMGRGNSHRVNRIFSMSLLIYSGIALIVMIAGLSLGDWLVADKLVIPEDKRGAAQIVLLAMLLSLSFMLVASVFESVLIARENMKLYAWLGITDALAKLGIAYAVMWLPDKLVVYAILMVVAQLVPYVIMTAYCLRHYPESRFSRGWDGSLIKEMFGFIGWNLYGSAAWMVNDQGISIILNFFFGPVVNAARGIAVAVNGAINNFNAQFFTAVRPQLVKRYAAQETASLITLIYSSTKFSVFLLWLLCLPIMLRAGFILNLWLADVPEWTETFVIWALLFTIVSSLCNPTYTAVSATGHIRRTSLIGGTLFLAAFPLSYVALKAGAPPMIVYPMLMAGRFAFFLVAVCELRKYVPVSFREYAVMVGWPVLKVLSVSFALMYALNRVAPQNLAGLLGVALAAVIVNGFLMYCFGSTAAERRMIVEKLNRILAKFRK